MKLPVGISRDEDDFAELLGKFILNFGAVEMFMYQMAYRQLKSKRKKKDFKENTFNQKLRFLSSLVEEGSIECNEETKERFQKIVYGIGVFYKVRNQLAHNPVLVKKTSSGVSEVLIPNMSEYPENEVSRAFDIDQIREYVDEVDRIATSFFEFLNVIDSTP